MTRPVRRLLTRAGLYREYVTRSRSARRIAADTGWSEQYVRDGLREFGIALRPAGGGNKAGGVLGAAELRGWIGQRLSVAEAADRSGYSTSGIYALCCGGTRFPPRPERPATGPAGSSASRPPGSTASSGGACGRSARISAAARTGPGLASRRPGRPCGRPAGRGGDTSWTQLLPRLVADGLTTVQIAVGSAGRPRPWPRPCPPAP